MFLPFQKAIWQFLLRWKNIYFLGQKYYMKLNNLQLQIVGLYPVETEALVHKIYVKMFCANCLWWQKLKNM